MRLTILPFFAPCIHRRLPVGAFHMMKEEDLPMPELTTVSISLASMEQAKQFVAIASRFPFEMDLRSGRYVVDAKSILGILSLGNRANILLDVYASDCADFLEAISAFRTDGAGA